MRASESETEGERLLTIRRHRFSIGENDIRETFDNDDAARSLFLSLLLSSLAPLLSPFSVDYERTLTSTSMLGTLSPVRERASSRALSRARDISILWIVSFPLLHGSSKGSFFSSSNVPATFASSMKRTRRFFIGIFLAEGNGNIVVSLPDTFGNLISRFAKINMSQKFVSRGSPGARSRNIRLDPLTPFKWSLQIILEGLARAALTISRRRLPPPLLPISAPPSPPRPPSRA